MNETNIMQLKIGLCGATGKTAGAIAEKIIVLQNQFQLAAKFSSKNSELELPEFCSRSDIIIDFSNIAILPELLKQCAVYEKPLVIGTTGVTEEHMILLRKYSALVPIIYSANMSLGANLLTSLIAKCASFLPSKDYDTEIIEYHHRYKKDAPSGTALALARAVARAKNIDFNENLVTSRSATGERNHNEIGISSVRGGGIKGEHEVIFVSDNEVIKLSHQVISRDAYADGALKAALWIGKQKPGLYSMQDFITSSGW